MVLPISTKLRSAIVDRRGNLAVITALCAFPLLGMMGLAMDYALATATKAKMDVAADAAAIAALTTAQNEISANSGASGNALSDAALQRSDDPERRQFHCVGDDAQLPGLLPVVGRVRVHGPSLDHGRPDATRLDQSR